MPQKSRLIRSFVLGMDETLSSIYAKADTLRRQIDDGTFQGDLQEKLTECISMFERCKELVDHLALFSQNEGIDDVASSEMKYLLINYYLGELCEKRFTTIAERQDFLLSAKGHYMSFFAVLESYSILPPEPKKALSAADLRAAKIAEYKLQKTLTTKISDLENKLDEEELRSWALSSIELAVIHTRQNLQSIQTELDVIASRPPPQEVPEPKAPNPDRLDRISRSGLPRSGPLLSGEGKVMRPFVLTSKRDQLAQGVFRPDHSLPTMSIDDYLTEEIRRGGIQLPQEEESQKSEQRVKSLKEEEEEEDRETMKQREWDDYVESHAKGSGNMGFNRG